MSEGPHYKLTYFDIRGLGECIKYIFAYKSIPYELETVLLFKPGKPIWFQKIKDEMPFGQLPILDIDGDKRLYQSIAICHYLGNKHGLEGGNSWDDAELLALAGSLHDIHMRAALFYYEKLIPKEIRLERINKSIPFYFQRFENILEQKGDYLNGKLTWVDFYVVGGLEHINGMMGEDRVTGVYPRLEELMKRIWGLPGVREYIATRPESPR